MNTVVATPLPNLGLPADADVHSLVLDSSGGLAITLTSASASETWIVKFMALGHRVLDEGDLLEYWPECSSRNGRLFRIEAGGWLEQEQAREGFLARVTQPEIKEYFVAGENACVSVLAWEPPDVVQG
jgi:hypothetical protein